MVQHRDPLVDALLRLGKATDFRQPAEGGAATTRAQVTRHLRPQNRDAASALVAAFRGVDDAQRLRAAASRARETGAHTPKEVVTHHRMQALLRCLEARKARLREQEQAQDQLAAQVKSQLAVAVEDQAKLTRLQQEQQQQRERANCLMQAHNRGRRLRPILENFTQHQRQQIQAVRSRMSGDADSSGDAAMEKVGQLCGLVQQELWQQLNVASIAAISAASRSNALLLTGADDMGTEAFAGALAAPFDSASPNADLAKHLHLPNSSALHRQVSGLLLLPPQKLAHAVCQLAKSSRNNLTVLLGGWDLLADARRRCQTLGAAVDPLFDVRKMQQSQVDSSLELKRLENQVQALKTRLLELALLPSVKQALNQQVVKARVQAEGYRAALMAARSSLEALRRDASEQAELVEEVGRLEAEAFELEREERRLESLVSLLTASLGQVLSEWQQQQYSNHEFLQRMLPKLYDELIDATNRNNDRLARCVAELMKVPSELLPAMAEQRRIQRLHGVGGAAADASGAAGLGRGGCAPLGLPSHINLPLVDRLRLALPFVGPQRAAAMLRAFAASGSSNFLGASSTQGSFLGLRGSATSTTSSQGASSQGPGSSSVDGVLMGSINASVNGVNGWPGAGLVAASTNSTMGSWSAGGPGQGLSSGTTTGWANRASGAADTVHGSGLGMQGPGGAGSGGVGTSGSWLHGGAAGTAAAPAVMWGPGPAALGLPTLCYWLATATAVDPLAPLRCPAALLRELHERFLVHDQVARWLMSADAQLRGRQRELAALRPANASLRELLDGKRQTDAMERLARLARSRKDMLKTVEACAPRVRRAMREMEEQGAVRLVPWRRVNGLTALEMLNEIRSLFARINQLQQQPHQPTERPYSALMPPPARSGF